MLQPDVEGLDQATLVRDLLLRGFGLLEPLHKLEVGLAVEANLELILLEEPLEAVGHSVVLAQFLVCHVSADAFDLCGYTLPVPLERALLLLKICRPLLVIFNQLLAKYFPLLVAQVVRSDLLSELIQCGLVCFLAECLVELLHAKPHVLVVLAEAGDLVVEALDHWKNLVPQFLEVLVLAVARQRFCQGSELLLCCSQLQLVMEVALEALLLLLQGGSFVAHAVNPYAHLGLASRLKFLQLSCLVSHLGLGLLCLLCEVLEPRLQSLHSLLLLLDLGAVPRLPLHGLAEVEPLGLLLDHLLQVLEGACSRALVLHLVLQGLEVDGVGFLGELYASSRLLSLQVIDVAALDPELDQLRLEVLELLAHESFHAAELLVCILIQVRIGNHALTSVASQASNVLLGLRLAPCLQVSQIEEALQELHICHHLLARLVLFIHLLLHRPQLLINNLHNLGLDECAR